MSHVRSAAKEQGKKWITFIVCLLFSSSFNKYSGACLCTYLCSVRRRRRRWSCRGGRWRGESGRRTGRRRRQRRTGTAVRPSRPDTAPRTSHSVAARAGRARSVCCARIAHCRTILQKRTTQDLQKHKCTTTGKQVHRRWIINWTFPLWTLSRRYCGYKASASKVEICAREQTVASPLNGRLVNVHFEKLLETILSEANI